MMSGWTKRSWPQGEGIVDATKLMTITLRKRVVTQVLMMRKVLVKVKVMQQNVMMLKPLLLVHLITIVV